MTFLARASALAGLRSIGAFSPPASAVFVLAAGLSLLPSCSTSPRQPASQGVSEKAPLCANGCGDEPERAAALPQQVPFDPALVATESRPAFVPHRGRGFASYVAVALPGAPAGALKLAAESAFGEKLEWRREAHLTAITPPEFHDVLASRLKIEDLERIAQETGLQQAPIEPVCLGRGEALVEGARHRAYFVVVRSPEALRFRRAVAEAFEAKGGAKGAFRAERWYPHVTIGFTKRDLHEEDGVRKDDNLCAARLVF